MTTSDPLKKSSYQLSQFAVTQYGAIVGSIFEAFFTVYYWLASLPMPTIWVNLAATCISLASLAWLLATRRSWLPAQLVTFALYLSLVGTALITGGIDSSSLYWLALVPVVAALMLGKKASLAWAIISLATVIGVFVLTHVLGVDNSTHQSGSLDRLVDLSLVTIAITIATLLNETTKRRMMDQLETAQANFERLANLDPLTGIYNRRYFLARAQRELDHAQANDSELSLLLIDLDHFEALNDNNGHIIGDQILCGFTQVCSAMLRKTDTLSRLGGEEFVVLLPQTNLAEALDVAERLRVRVEETAIQTDLGMYRITVSIGDIAQTSASTQSIEQLVNQADNAMYRAKQAGRNRIAVWQ